MAESGADNGTFLSSCFVLHCTPSLSFATEPGLVLDSQGWHNRGWYAYITHYSLYRKRISNDSILRTIQINAINVQHIAHKDSTRKTDHIYHLIASENGHHGMATHAQTDSTLFSRCSYKWLCFSIFWPPCHWNSSACENHFMLINDKILCFGFFYLKCLKMPALCICAALTVRRQGQQQRLKMWCQSLTQKKNSFPITKKPKTPYHLHLPYEICLLQTHQPCQSSETAPVSHLTLWREN